MEAIKASTETHRTLAERFGVSRETIKAIRSGRRHGNADPRAKGRPVRASPPPDPKPEPAAPTASLEAVVAEAQRNLAARREAAAGAQQAAKAEKPKPHAKPHAKQTPAPAPTKRRDMLALAAGLSVRKAALEETAKAPEVVPVAPTVSRKPRPKRQPSEARQPDTPATRDQLARASVLHMLMRSGHLPLDPSLRFQGLSVDYEAAAEDVAYLAWRFEHDVSPADLDAALSLHGIRAV